MNHVLSAMATEPRRYRCSKGHEWEEPDCAIIGHPNVIIFGDKIYCLRCWQEQVVAGCGTVEEVTDVMPDAEVNHAE